MTHTATTGPRRKVLVVDDVMLNRKLAIALLSKLGFEASEVDGGHAAIDWLAQRPQPDFVLLDISMPDLNGEEVCHRLRANPANAGLKIVAYTAHAGSEDAERFLANGFDAVLIKPISLKCLTQVVNQLF
jgi:CheY-like chemotaxis protein